MRPRTVGVTALAIAGGAAVLLSQNRQRAASQAGEPAQPRSRWRAVTIYRTPEEVMPGGRPPGPLASLGSEVEVAVAVAPGDKGTELKARLRNPGAETSADGKERIRRVRAALRESKQLIEVGEILRVDPTPHGRRPATPTGAVVELATKRAPQEGLL